MLNMRHPTCLSFAVARPLSGRGARSSGRRIILGEANFLPSPPARLHETGSHQELLAQRGIYWKLYQLQYQDQEARQPAFQPE